MQMGCAAAPVANYKNRGGMNCRSSDNSAESERFVDSERAGKEADQCNKQDTGDELSLYVSVAPEYLQPTAERAEYEWVFEQASALLLSHGTSFSLSTG